MIEYGFGDGDQILTYFLTRLSSLVFKLPGDLSMLFGSVDADLPVTATQRVTGQSIVIPLGDRVEFVVVTAGARDRQSKK